LEYYELEMTHPNNARLSNTFIDQQASSWCSLMVLP